MTGAAASTPHRFPRASGYARKNAPPPGVLPMPASARVIRTPVPNQLGRRVTRATVPNERLRGRVRLRHIFRPSAARCPHRAGEPIWHWRGS